ncbi:MAG: serine hydrolase [Candidatus Latescibacterota bacterium]
MTSLVATLAIATAANVSLAQTLELLDGSTVPIERVEKSIVEITERAGVTGLSVAIINGSRVVYAKGFGVRDEETGSPTDGETEFAAASFSKTVFAYLVVLLAGDGVIDLDEPLYRYLEKPLPDYPKYADLEHDERYRAITARTVLSHTTGLPNWRFLTSDGKLTLQWAPGERFGYSGEGVDLLQMVVEEITGTGLEDLARERVFGPLGMTRTSYVWRDRFADNLAVPHDKYGRPRRYRKRREADAAGSMTTTAGDYAKLIVAVLEAGKDGKPAMEAILQPQVVIRSRSMFGPGSREDVGGPDRLFWGIGWGLFDCPAGRAFFHTGHEGGTQNYNVTFADKGIGVVFLSNSDNFESAARELAQATIGDVYSPFDWLGYPRFDPDEAREPPPEPEVVHVDRSVLESYTGTYRLSAGIELIVELRDGQLACSTDGIDWVPLLGRSEARFFVKGEDFRIEFVSGGNGRATGVILDTEGVELRGQRTD